jgi:hypothetical protein
MADRLVPSVYATAALGLAAASSGDTVTLADGTYTEHSLHVPAGVILRGTSRAGTIIDASGGGAGTDGVIIDSSTGVPQVQTLTINNAVRYGITGNSTNRRFNVTDVAINNPGSHGLNRLADDSTVTRVKVTEAGGRGANGNTAKILMYAVEVVDCADEGVYATKAGTVLEHITSVGCAASSGGYQIQGGTGATARNCIAHAGGVATSSGITAGTYVACNSYGHSGNDFAASPDAASITTDPLFVDLDGRDLRLQAASPAVAAGSTTATTLTDVDGKTYGPIPAMGAHARPFIAYVVPRGEAVIWLRATDTFSADAASPESWSLGGPSERGLVAAVSVNATDATLTLDRPMREGVTYTLTTTATVGGLGDLPAVSWVAMPVTVAPRGTEAGELGDIYAAPGETYKTDDSGDLANSAGLETLRKVVIRYLLTAIGSVVYAPGYGGGLAHKRPKPVDLDDAGKRIARGIEGLPGITAARVTLTWSGDHVIADLLISTSLGQFDDLLEVR